MSLLRDAEHELIDVTGHMERSAITDHDREIASLCFEARILIMRAISKSRARRY